MNVREAFDIWNPDTDVDLSRRPARDDYASWMGVVIRLLGLRVDDFVEEMNRHLHANAGGKDIIPLAVRSGEYWREVDHQGRFKAGDMIDVLEKMYAEKLAAAMLGRT